MLITNSTVIYAEPWFIPFDIIMIITTIFCIVLGTVFILIAITHRICWCVSMLLICNSCLAEVILSCSLLSMAVFSFQNDLKQTTENISSWVIEAFFTYASFIAQDYSYFLIAMYRYIAVVYPARVFWQSAKFQIRLVMAQWIFSIVAALPLLLTGQISYNIDNQVYQVPLRILIPKIYLTVVLYMIPNMGIVIIYIKLVRYVRQISNRTTVLNTLFHARRELRLVQRTFILTCTLIIIGMPYMIFTIMSFITIPYIYHFRIAFLCIDVSILVIIIMTYCFTQQITKII